MALPEGHKYRALADRSYRPKHAPNDEQWELAYQLLVEILAADPGLDQVDQRTVRTRRGALATHLYWLAGEYPDQLDADFALDERQVIQSSACSKGYRTERSRAAYMSKLRYFRKGYPKLFPAKVPVPTVDPSEPVSDNELEIALRAAGTFRNPRTCDRTRAMLLLSRAAGASATDCRYLTGTDVFWRPGAGLWVRLGAPDHLREVPVLQRFASALDELARRAGPNTLISLAPPPAPLALPPGMTLSLQKRMKGQYPRQTITTSRLRKTWMLEQLLTWEKLHLFLQAAGVKSMHTVDDLLPWCPSPATDPPRLAGLLGGIAPRGRA